MGRDITKCHPRLQKLAEKLVEKGKKQGLIIGIGECFRTVAEQNDLYAQGRTRSGSIVTNAPGSSYSSHHQWGTAFDVYRNDGKGAYNDSDGWFAKVGRIGQKLGLEWGGSWTSPVDKPHFQLPDWGSTTSQLKAKYGTAEAFRKTWAAIEPSKPQKLSKVKLGGVTVKPGARYEITLGGYLWKTCSVKGGVISYKEIPESYVIKKKCVAHKRNGYAVLKAGEEVNVKEIVKAEGRYWAKTVSGYWIILLHEGEVRVKKANERVKMANERSNPPAMLGRIE